MRARLIFSIPYADCPSLEPRVDTDTVARTVLTPDFLQPIDGADLAGNTQTLYVYDAAQDTVVADIADFNVDGTGTTRLLGLSFTWGDERRIVPLAMDGDRIYWLEQRRFDNIGGVTSATPATRLVRFYDYEPLIAPVAVGDQKTRMQLPPSKQRALLRGPQLR